MSRRAIIIVGSFLLIVGVLVFTNHKHYSEVISVVTATEIKEVPELTAKTWGLFDVETGLVIEGYDVDVVRSIASITKLFTAYSVVSLERQEEEALLVWQDVVTEGRSGKIVLGDTKTLHDLFFPLLIESSNDAGAAIGRVLGVERVFAIERLSDELKLNDTVIKDSTGLSARNVSTVTDLSKFFSYLYQKYPAIIDITQLKMYISDDVGLINNNPASNIDSFAGGKNGFLYEAGKTFVGVFNLENEEKIGIVLLGSEDIESDIVKLLSYSE